MPGVKDPSVKVIFSPCQTVSTLRQPDDSWFFEGSSVACRTRLWAGLVLSLFLVYERTPGVSKRGHIMSIGIVRTKGLNAAL